MTAEELLIEAERLVLALDSLTAEFSQRLFSEQLASSGLAAAVTFISCDFFLRSDILATGCNDKCVRVYYLATSIDKELKKFTGN